MKFTLTYDGDLPAASRDKPRTREKWDIREKLSPQLDDLWHFHPTLQRVMANRIFPKSMGTVMVDSHHSNPIVYMRPYPDFDPQVHIDLCAAITKTHPERGVSANFRPLVRRTLALGCSLSILFMRYEPRGNIYKRGDDGGDLDNRLKVLLDALSIPEPQGILEEAKPENPIYCLLEDDALVMQLNIDTRRLLARPEAKPSEVQLVIDVDVRVTDARSYNSYFMGD